jgi:hypothetical protein
MLLSAKIQRISQITVINPTILYKLVGLMYEITFAAMYAPPSK